MLLPSGHYKLDPCIIVFVGTVGAGKSTQVKKLLMTLKKGGTNASSTVLKRGHLFAYLFEIFLAKSIKAKAQDTPYPIEVIIRNRPDLLKKFFKLFLAIDTISIFYRFILTVYLPKKMGYVVIVEEYLQATIADYEWLSKLTGANKSVLFTRLLTSLAVLGGPTYTVYLDAPNATLRARWVNRQSPIQRIEYIEMQRTLLFSISKRLFPSLTYINTEKTSINKTASIILKTLNCKF